MLLNAHVSIVEAILTSMMLPMVYC